MRSSGPASQVSWSLAVCRSQVRRRCLSPSKHLLTVRVQKSVWTEADKTGFGTARTRRSNVWFTIQRGPVERGVLTRTCPRLASGTSSSSSRMGRRSPIGSRPIPTSERFGRTSAASASPRSTPPSLASTGSPSSSSPTPDGTPSGSGSASNHWMVNATTCSRSMTPLSTTTAWTTAAGPLAAPWSLLMLRWRAPWCHSLASASRPTATSVSMTAGPT